MMVPDLPLLWTVWIGSAVIWLGLSLLVLRRWKLPQPSAPWIILGVAALVRLGYVFLMPPVLSDDLWRYLHDGQTLAAGQNPYAVAPLEVIQRAEAAGEGESVAWMKRINNPELVTIYLPTSQWVFAGITKACDTVTGGHCGAEAAQRAFRLAFALVDLAVVALLIGRLRRAGRSAWWAVLFAWSPLVIAETAWSGHQDGLGILPLIGVLLLTERAGRLLGGASGRSSGGAWLAALCAGALLGLAAGVKPIVLPLALPLAWKLVRDAGWPGATRAAGAAAACVAVLAALFVPFLMMEGGMDGLFETSQYFVEKWRFNGSIHALVEAAVRPTLSGEVWEVGAKSKAIADVVCGGLLAAVLFWVSWACRDLWRVALAFFFALVCLTSTVHPWYLLWAVALLPLAWAESPTSSDSPGLGAGIFPGVWVASLTLPWSYAAWLNVPNGGTFDGEYQPGLAVTLAVWVPVYAVLVGGIAAAAFTSRGSEPRGCGCGRTA